MNESKSDLVKQKRDGLIEMTDGFADQYLNEEYKMLCRKLINKMSRKRQVPFLSGKMDIWAAAVVYALGQINFLFDNKFEPYVSGTDLCDYFGTSQSTTSRKAKIIRDMFKMRYFDEEFSTEKMNESNPVKDLIMIDGLIFPRSAIPEVLDRKVRGLAEALDSFMDELEDEFDSEEESRTEEE